MKFSERVDHCSGCGSADPDDVDTYADPEFQGYSRCCNEPVGSDHARCTHE
jgi:hypothetical protein